MLKHDVYIIAAGGSGGHVLPALYLIKKVLLKYRAIYANDNRASKYLKYNRYFLLYSIYKKKRRYKLNNNINIAKIIYENRFMYKKNIIVFGGYNAIIFILYVFIKASNIHEQNIILGQINYILLHRTRNILASLPQKLDKKSKKLVGLPISFDYYFNDKKKAKKINILILGGSQGSNIFDIIMTTIAKNIDKTFVSQLKITQQIQEYNIVEIIRKYNKTNITYNIQTFIKSNNLKYSKKDCIISRAGASASIEIIFTNNIFLFIPYSYAKNNHQFYNVKFIRKNLSFTLQEERFLCIEWGTVFLLYVIVNFNTLLSNRKEYLIRLKKLQLFSINNILKKIRVI